MWRQGDVFIAEVGKIPPEAKRLPHCVLAEGELTGHSHRIDEPHAAELYELRGQKFLRVTAIVATVVHDEHGPLQLAQGKYRVWMQREFDPTAHPTAPPGERIVSDWQFSRYVVD